MNIFISGNGIYILDAELKSCFIPFQSMAPLPLRSRTKDIQEAVSNMYSVEQNFLGMISGLLTVQEPQ